jgi:uncharacterized membrane protein YwzB
MKIRYDEKIKKTQNRQKIFCLIVASILRRLGALLSDFNGTRINTPISSPSGALRQA